jgi:FADH2 O2-dependent halogenase
MFEGGWLWIIPFNNHPYSTNTLCSVGLQFDIDKHGPAGDPEEEFTRFLDEHPPLPVTLRARHGYANGPLHLV